MFYVQVVLYTFEPNIFIEWANSWYFRIERAAPTKDAIMPQDPINTDEIDQENHEWLESLDYIYKSQGPERVRDLLGQLRAHALERSIQLQLLPA